MLRLALHCQHRTRSPFGHTLTCARHVAMLTGMTIAPEGRRTTSLAQLVAAEIRAEMGRQRLSQRALARSLDRPDVWLMRRLRGDQALDLEELELIAKALKMAPETLVERAVALRAIGRSSLTGEYAKPADQQARPPIRLRPASYPDEYAGPPDRSRRPVRLAGRS
jgi:transcriptional regulator with XRE-family HTH domain